jgi:hypothetical protein
VKRIPCNPEVECRFRETEGCFEDTDHFYFPARFYKTAIEKAFRQLEINKTRICRRLHEERHATELPPDKPAREEMLRVIHGNQEPLQAVQDFQSRMASQYGQEMLLLSRDTQ